MEKLGFTLSFHKNLDEHRVKVIDFSGYTYVFCINLFTQREKTRPCVFLTLYSNYSNILSLKYESSGTDTMLLAAF